MSLSGVPNKTVIWQNLEIQNLNFACSDCKIPWNIIWDEKYQREFSFTLHYMQTQATL